VFEGQINRAILLITRSMTMSVSVAGAMWSAERAVIIASFCIFPKGVAGTTALFWVTTGFLLFCSRFFIWLHICSSSIG
jgi:hypothetical protein